MSSPKLFSRYQKRILARAAHFQHLGARRLIEIDEIRHQKDAYWFARATTNVAYNREMALRTRELIKQAESLPTDESSINCGDREFADNHAALAYFSRLKSRFVDLSNWNGNSGLSSYALFDRDGRPVAEQRIRPGLFLRITLTGSGKSDWVRIEDIYDSPEEFIITVSPTYDPTAQPPQTGKISHFFTSDATNNFCALLEGNKVSVCVIGLNERLNSGHTSGVVETVRNTAVANIGYYLGIQKSEWNKFCNSFLTDEAGHASK